MDPEHEESTASIKTETDVVAPDGNSYTGTNDTKLCDLDGGMFHEVVGTAAATRIEL